MEIMLPSDVNLSISPYDMALYNYDFNPEQQADLQRLANRSLLLKIREQLFAHSSDLEIIHNILEGKAPEYVASFSTEATRKLKAGEWALGIRRSSGKTMAIIKDVATGKIRENATLAEKDLKRLKNLPEFWAVQHQLNEISEQISNLSSLVFSIEQGQYDDRFSGFLSSRQTLIEGLISSDTQTRKTLILSSIVNNNETIGKLMFSLRREANLFINPNVSTEQANESEHFLNESFWYLNQTIQLNLIAYVALGEIRPLTASLNNYKAFIEQVLLTSDKNGKTLSWHIDNTHVGNQGKLGLTARYITTQIDGLVKKTNYKQLEGGSNIDTQKLRNL